MAVYNEILAARFARAVQKLFSMKGSVPTKQLSGDIQAVLPLFFGAESRYLEGWNRYSLGRFLGISAGNQNGHRLRNPTNSGVVAVMEKILIQNDSTAAQRYVLTAGPTTTDFTPVTLTFSRLDPRGPAVSTLIYSEQQAAAVTDLSNTLAFVTVAQVAGATPQYDYVTTDDSEIPLLPGDAIQLRSNNQGVSEFLGIVWRERILEESERF